MVQSSCRDWVLDGQLVMMVMEQSTTMSMTLMATARQDMTMTMATAQQDTMTTTARRRNG